MSIQQTEYTIRYSLSQAAGREDFLITYETLVDKYGKRVVDRVISQTKILKAKMKIRSNRA